MSTVLETRHLRREFGGLTAVSDVTMSVDEGEIYGIVGPNGAGKTTLFNLVAGTIRPTSGQLTLFGTRADRLPMHRRSWLGLGRTFQAAQLFGTHTVAQGLRTARGSARRGMGGWLAPRDTDEDRRALAELLELTGLTDVADSLPSGLTNVQQQQLAIGMAVATGARLLLLDEPSGGLIESEVGQLLDFIKGLRDRGHTIVVIDHKMRLMMHLCDRIMVMTAGEELAVGTPHEIASNPEVQDAYLGRKAAALVTSSESSEEVGHGD
jgi:branched-chain amino acid transport system ATP-binding protein